MTDYRQKAIEDVAHTTGHTAAWLRFEMDRPLQTVPRLAVYAVAQREARLRLEEEILTVERKYRNVMWLSHGHSGKYGDDGEMQCGECSKYGCWDYKNSPLKEVESAYQFATLERAAALNAVKEGEL